MSLVLPCFMPGGAVVAMKDLREKRREIVEMWESWVSLCCVSLKGLLGLVCVSGGTVTPLVS
jgi:hypothetical protein